MCKEPGCSFTHHFPTLVGPSPVMESPQAPAQITTTPEEGNRIIDSVLTDPETPTIVPGLPPAGDPFWTAPDVPPDPAYPEPGQQPDPDDPFPAPAPTEPGYEPSAPDSDPNKDSIPNRDDQDDDGDHVPDGSDPHPYAPEEKPWLEEGFRAPSDPAQREALWGPVVEEWQITDETGAPDPDGGGCQVYDYGTLICEWPDGYVYVNIDKDYTAWFEEPNGQKSRVTTRDQRRTPEEYVADTGIFADRPGGPPAVSEARRRYIDARYLRNPNVTLYVPDAVVRELSEHPSATQDARLAGLTGGAKIYRVSDASLDGIDTQSLCEKVGWRVK